MFETATFESTGSITTQSRKWMLATLALNSSVIALLILIPLMHPELLPGHGFISLITAPTAPHEQPPVHAQADNLHATTVPRFDPFAAPRQIPARIDMRPQPEQMAAVDWNAMDSNTAVGADHVFHSAAVPRVMHEEVKGPVHVASQLLEGTIVFKRTPAYPAIARAAGIQGTVVLQATISKTGTIENLRVQGGPGILQQAALEAVKSWRYRPYILNGQPVEVETTVNVVFSLSR